MMNNQLKRPWQGTALTVIYSLVSLVAPIISGLQIYIFIEAYILSQNAMIAARMLQLFPLLYGISFILFAILILLSVGVFVGKRWVVFILTILSFLNIFNGILVLKKVLFAQFPENFAYLKTIFVTVSILEVVVMIFAVWLAIICLKHPFYGGNGRTTLDSFKFWKKQTKRDDEMTTF